MADLVGLLFALSAGAVTLLNPCGWALLPGYVSFLIGAKASPTRAIVFGLVATAGFVGIFFAVGVAISLARSAVNEALGYLVLVSSAIVIILAVSMLAQRPILPFHFSAKLPTSPDYGPMLVFGFAYGLASIACAAPLFFSLLAYAIAVGGFVDASVTLALYGVGMGVPIVAISILVANGKAMIFERLSPWIPRLQRLGSIGLLVVGGYLLYFYYIYYIL